MDKLLSSCQTTAEDAEDDIFLLNDLKMINHNVQGGTSIGTRDEFTMQFNVTKQHLLNKLLLHVKRLEGLIEE